MEDKELCRQLHRVAYKSCIDNYFVSGDRNDIHEYWLQLIEAKRSCEALGVQKALELIELMKDLNGKD
tara:strand:- start:2678 stop:2881 length:204 start_codon:yes stop_codon:yes gene_type:complete